MRNRGVGAGLFACVLAIGTWAYAAKPEGLEALIHRYVPPVLKDIVPGKTSRAEALALLGKPMSGSTETDLYFRLAREPADINDLTLGVKGAKLRYVFYQLPRATELKFAAFESYLPADALKKAREAQKKSAHKRDGEPLLDIEIPERGLLLKFRATEVPTLWGVVWWKPGEPKP